jgi:hypothetical protein
MEEAESDIGPLGIGLWANTRSGKFKGWKRKEGAVKFPNGRSLKSDVIFPH